ncbi:MAG: phosphoribosyl-ATP diphosphatase [Christensenellaceae bacterium]|jgi:phosphoribosyl-ATP pyrophosphohydrolase|nr:phosphoribosyl-ATP diphosphatase [Christensenellaceae bacterium]
MKNSDLIIKELYDVILKRMTENIEGSYTCYLFQKGLDKILKKCGEECTETIIAAKNGSPNEIVNEVSDLIYHILVLLVECKIPLSNVLDELSLRSAKQSNLKPIKSVDKNT